MIKRNQVFFTKDCNVYNVPKIFSEEFMLLQIKGLKVYPIIE
jgi:hypothetical protein